MRMGSFPSGVPRTLANSLALSHTKLKLNATSTLYSIFDQINLSALFPSSQSSDVRQANEPTRVLETPCQKQYAHVTLACTEVRIYIVLFTDHIMDIKIFVGCPPPRNSGGGKNLEPKNLKATFLPLN